ncbi:hypothetical protein D3C78_1338000 [compost metagenome]
MSNICREKLLKSIQVVHVAVLNYSNCLCEEISEEDTELIFRFGTELSVQLKELRNLYKSLYGVDPLNGFDAIPSVYNCATRDHTS